MSVEIQSNSVSKAYCSLSRFPSVGAASAKKGDLQNSQSALLFAGRKDLGIKRLSESRVQPKHHISGAANGQIGRVEPRKVHLQGDDESESEFHLDIARVR